MLVPLWYTANHVLVLSRIVVHLMPQMFGTLETYALNTLQSTYASQLKALLPSLQDLLPEQDMTQWSPQQMSLALVETPSHIQLITTTPHQFHMPETPPQLTWLLHRSHQWERFGR